MRPKQEEMDGIVKLIYEYTEKIDQERKKNDTTAKSTLIVLCGDHGMNEVRRVTVYSLIEYELIDFRWEIMVEIHIVKHLR
jgi:hypothetical protein